MNTAEQLANGGIDESLTWWASNDDCDSQTVFLYRKEAGQDCLLDRYTVDQQTMPSLEDFQFAVKEQHGGGIYQAVVRKPNGQLVKRLPFSLAGLPKRHTPAETPAPAAPVESSTDKLIAMLIQNQQRSDERLAQVLEKISEKPAKPEKPEVDPLDMLEKAASLLSKNGATPLPQKSLIEQMMELKQANELLGLGNGDGTESGWGSIAALAAPLMDAVKENTVTERLRLQLEADRQKQQQPAPGKVARQITAPAPVASPFSALLAGFKPVLPQLVSAAQAGHPAVNVAGHLLNIVPADQKPQLLAFLRQDTALADMAELEPGIEQHWDWFTELAVAILATDGVGHAPGHQSTTSASPAGQLQNQDPGRGSGHTANAGADGGAGKTRPRNPKRQGASTGAGGAVPTEGLSG